MAEASSNPRINVLAGTNGAGKSSIGGAAIRSEGSDYFNPDEAARRIAELTPGLTIGEANALAWQLGRRQLERAIAERLEFTFETTLGGTTITSLLEAAVASGIDVRIWYIGLTSPDLHIARVRARVATGGHDIPEAKIRERYDRSRLNLIRLLPGAAEVWVYDNSEDGDPRAGTAPSPTLILHTQRGRVITTCNLAAAPEWTRPILAAALKAGR